MNDPSRIQLENYTIWFKAGGTNDSKECELFLFTQTYKLPETLVKDYQLLAECTERLSKIEMDQLIPKQFIEQDFNVRVKKQVKNLNMSSF